MRPLEAMTCEEGARIQGLLFDLDDTFLTHGVLTRGAYDALWDMHDAGIALVVVTGRPSLWGQFVARQWPIDAATTENGAISILREGKHVARVDPCDPAEREARRSRLAALVEDMAARLPALKLADDTSGRISDVAWDIGENVRVPPETIAQARSIIAEHGAGARPRAFTSTPPSTATTRRPGP
jgi:hypothetical protein